MGSLTLEKKVEKHENMVAFHTNFDTEMSQVAKIHSQGHNNFYIAYFIIMAADGWPDVRRQGINSNGVDLVCSEHRQLGTEKIKSQYMIRKCKWKW